VYRWKESSKDNEYNEKYGMNEYCDKTNSFGNSNENDYIKSLRPKLLMKLEMPKEEEEKRNDEEKLKEELDEKDNNYIEADEDKKDNFSFKKEKYSSEKTKKSNNFKYTEISSLKSMSSFEKSKSSFISGLELSITPALNITCFDIHPSIRNMMIIGSEEGIIIKVSKNYMGENIDYYVHDISVESKEETGLRKEEEDILDEKEKIKKYLKENKKKEKEKKIENSKSKEIRKQGENSEDRKDNNKNFEKNKDSGGRNSYVLSFLFLLFYFIYYFIY
jgi:hypothetical protein